MDVSLSLERESSANLKSPTYLHFIVKVLLIAMFEHLIMRETIKMEYQALIKIHLLA